MKAKLHKMVSGYIVSLNGDIDDPYAIVNEELAKDHEWYRLSLRNCQVIERGYDLDVLAENFWKEEFMKPGLIDTSSYKKGFQKALEILGDKKFSEDDLLQAVEMYYGEGKTFIEVIQSLQQTEWEVEIVTENVCGRCYSNNTNECWSTKECSDGKYDYPKPLLDEDGCLILKRI